MQWRDALNVGGAPLGHYPDDRLGQLQSIRDLLGGAEEANDYDANVTGVLTHIRDLLNTGDTSVAHYPQTQHGLWQAIRDFSGAPPSGPSIYDMVRDARDAHAD
jgi:hypothetical protein